MMSWTTTPPLIITKGSDKAVVMVSLEDWNAWQETMYLLRSPANAERLIGADTRL